MKGLITSIILLLFVGFSQVPATLHYFDYKSSLYASGSGLLVWA